MTNKKLYLYKAFKIAFYITTSIIIVLVALSSLLVNEKLQTLLRSWYFILPWFLLVVLTIFFPLFFKKRNSRKEYIIIHYPFIVLIILTFLSFNSIRSASFELEKNIPTSFDNQFDLGLDDTSLTLKNFDIEYYDQNFNDIKSYKSEIIIEYEGKKKTAVVEVSKPVRFYPYTVYQNSWAFYISDIVIEFDGAEYDLFSQNESPIITNDGNYFEFHPIGYSNSNIIYEWNLISAVGERLEKGNFSSADELFIANKYKLFLIEENYIVNSILEVSYNPFGPYLAVSSVIFLLAMFLQFFRKKEIDSLKEESENV